MTQFQSVFAKAGIAFAAVLGLTQAASASVVFENLGNHDNFSSGSSAEIGDQVTLAGTARIVTDFKAEFYVTALSGDESVTVRFYDIGADSKPGNLLGLSNSKALSTAGFGTINLSGLSVSVPDSFVWTVSFDGVNGVTEKAGLIFPGNAVPGIGSSDNFYFSREGGVFEAKNSAGLVNNFAAQITAVPEPGTWALLLTGIAGLGAYGYRRKS